MIRCSSDRRVPQLYETADGSDALIPLLLTTGLAIHKIEEDMTYSTNKGKL
jgi:hypothetical protein